MTPNFALGLTDDGITLWHRDPAGWLRVGAVPMDSADMDSRMRKLVDTAHLLAPDGIRTKLVIPDDQILFCDLTPSGTSHDQKADSLRKQLVGRTPYPVEELVFDWVEKGSSAHLAVTARETVMEAEEFAKGYGLNPVSAVAAPASDRFAQEPFFCTTRTARSVPGDPASLSQHRDMVREKGMVTLPAPKPPATAPKPTPEPAKAAAPATAPDLAKPAPAPPIAKPAKAGPELAPTTAKTVDESPRSAPAAAKPADTSVDTSDSKSTLASTALTSSAQDTVSRKTLSIAAQARKSALLGKLMAAKEVRPTPSAEARAQTGASSGFAAILESKLKRETAEEAAQADAPPVAAFQSRRGRPAESAQIASESPKDKAAAAPLSSVLPALQRQAERGKGAMKSLLGGFTAKTAGTAAKTASPPAAATPATLAAALTRTPTPKPAAGSPAKPASPTPERRDPLTTLREQTAARSQTEAERLTIFGARNHQPEAGASGGQRALMILGGVALLLVAVAIWALYFQGTRPASVDLADDVTAPLATDLALDAPVAEDVTALEDIEAALGLEDAAQQPPLSLGEPDLADSGIAEQTLTERHDTPVEPQSGRIAGLRSVSLIAPVDAVPFPAAPPAPAPFGTEPLPPLRSELVGEPALDLSQAVADSLAEALAAGDPSPAGGQALPAGEEALTITPIQGRPAAVPPRRPEGLVSEDVLAALRPEPVVSAPEAPLAEAAAAPAAQAAASATPAPTDESALEITVTAGTPSAVPPARPEAIAPEAEAVAPVVPAPDAGADGSTEIDPEDQARLATPPPGGVALTALRPAARPENLPVHDTTAPETPDFADASALAVPASMRPGARPAQFAAIVQRTLAARPAQTAAAAPQPQTQQAPAPQPPVQTASAAVAAPPIPTSASVAREATQTRAINLREINLIGVMGTSSNRRALVRLSNGRIVTVRIGESLDGGQVTAIGDTELRYVRRGRDVVLRLAS